MLKTIDQIADDWVFAFNAKDIDKLLRLYHDDARHYSPRVEEQKPETKGWLQGKDELRDWWQKSFTNLPTLNYKITGLMDGNGEAVIRYIKRVNGEANSEVWEYFKVENGLIQESRVLRSWEIS